MRARLRGSVRRLALVLLVAPVVGVPGVPGVPPGANEETQAMLESQIADDQGRTLPKSRALRLLPVDLDVLTPNTRSSAVALPAGQGVVAPDDPRPVALAATSGQTGTADSTVTGDGGVVERRVPITFYSCQGPNGGFCGAMSSGNMVYEGAAACGSAYALGERVSIVGDPTGRVYVCEDRGWLAPTQVDVFWYREEDGWAWIAQMGIWAEVLLERGSTATQIRSP